MHPPEFSVTISVAPACQGCDVVVAGDFDAQNVPLFAQSIEFALGISPQVDLNLRHVRIFGSAAVRALRHALSLSDQHGCIVRVEPVPPHIAVVLDAVGMADDRIARADGADNHIAASSSPPTERSRLGDFTEAIADGVLHSRESICITTGDISDPQVLFVNDAFTTLTGHERSTIDGRNPKLLQGPLTDRAVIDRLKKSLSNGEDFVGEAINYRADGTPFWMNWRIHTVKNRGATLFMALQHDRTRLRQYDRLDTARLRMSRTLDRSPLVPSRQEVLEALSDAVAIVIESDTAVVTTALMAAHGELIAANLEGSVNEPVVTDRKVVYDPTFASMHVPFPVSDETTGYLLIHQIHPDWLQLIDERSLDELCQTAAIYLRNLV